MFIAKTTIARVDVQSLTGEFIERTIRKCERIYKKRINVRKNLK